MSVVIPANFIETIYVYPEEEYVKPFGKAWLFMESSTRWIYAVLLAAFLLANVFGRRAFSDPGVYLVLAGAAVIVFVTVIIKSVERSEAKAQVDAVHPDDDNVHVSFDALSVTIEKQLGAERYCSVIPRSDIKKISGYVQNGWFSVRDRGVVIERNDGAQFRFVFSLKKSQWNDFLLGFEESLKRFDYPLGPLRRFQV